MRVALLLCAIVLGACSAARVTTEEPAARVDPAVTATAAPAPTLRPDAFDAPVAVSMAEAAKGAGEARRAVEAAEHEVHEHAAAVYTCPMHPEVTSATPGTCPKCGMTLVKKDKQRSASSRSSPRRCWRRARAFRATPASAKCRKGSPRANIEWSASDERVRAMLAEELTAEGAVAIAVANNPRLQVTLAELGIARADLIETSTISNPILEFELRVPG